MLYNFAPSEKAVLSYTSWFPQLLLSISSLCPLLNSRHSMRLERGFSHLTKRKTKALVPTLPEHEVYTPRSEVPCLDCEVLIPLTGIADHILVCNPSPSPSSSAGGENVQHVVGTGGEGPIGGAGVVLESSRPHVLVGIGGHGETEGGPGVVVRSPRPLAYLDLDYDELEEDLTLLPASQLPVESEETIEESEVIQLDSPPQAGSRNHQEDAQIRQEQDVAFRESLRTDQRRDWQQALQAQHDVNSSAEAVVDEREQEQRQQQIEQWYQTIRYDLRQMLPQEPPEGVAGNISVRVRLPNGDRVTRRFNSSERMESIFNLVGSQECVNPRRFRILLADTANPREVPRHINQLMTEAGFSSFTLVIVENTEGATPEDIRGIEPGLGVNVEEVTMTETTEATTSVEGVNSKSAAAATMQSPNDLEKVRSKLRLECASARRIHRAKVSRVDILTGFVDLYGCNPNLTENEI
ncbi:uncharacterized protein LOC135336319 [Halichondria panicea]|uniref:uncharacterized protein LOC135336319 n=1 Tax=Halichondria panicea TaxID=6063 RepID=UPI00312B6E08